MKYFITGIIAITIIAACNNAGQGSRVSVDTIKSADSSSTNVDPASTPHVPQGLTPDEIGDDTVFADKSVPTSWANAGIDDPVALKLFLKTLQRWVTADQRDSVVSVIAFPLANPKVKNKEAFIKQYDKYFNDKVKTALKNQNFRQIFRRDIGAMIGNGELWLGQVQGGFAITAINNE